ncbi:hypothetical protein HI113_20890 [Corallococcus exiguus]|uniref:hypothetical protein n=1 Tax=Corallococcus TaxID=83461 RepID=UPI0011C36EB3|nr:MULTISPECIES: hypothetical protein [Corallococcus]NNB96353.1 hypothetical protein [Corallococcus exiguus]NPC48957.1 hypothetical protein [Corallococcus exiguus]
MGLMRDEDVLNVLRAKEKLLTPVELAELLGGMLENGISHSVIVFYFKRAFPSIPLRALLESGLWWRVGKGGMSDQEFNEHLKPWVGRGVAACNGGHLV